jgi:hypothetical protein
MTPSGSDDERFEHIPWEHLKGPEPNRRWVLYAGAGALVAAALTASFVRARPVSPASAPTSMTLSATAAVVTPTVPALTTTLLASEADPPTEADLMAVPAELLAAQAAAWAEWVTSLYFTIDGGDGPGQALGSILPASSPTPIPTPGQRSYVEWARAIDVAEIAPAEYLVEVAVRTLGAMAEEPYRRMPARSIIWRLRWTPDGWSVLDLPEIGAMPDLVVQPSWPNAELPAPVAAATAGIGQVLGGGGVGDLWRVVVALPDSLGGTWPVVVWMTGDGQRVDGPRG